MTGPTVADLHGSMDAYLWAQEFVRINPGTVDLSTMLGWFANAIMAGYDAGGVRARRQEDDFRAFGHFFLDRLTSEGGAIVSSGSCSVLEIADARSNGRMFVDSNHYGYIIRTKKWLDRVHELDDYL